MNSSPTKDDPRAWAKDYKMPAGMEEPLAPARPASSGDVVPASPQATPTPQVAASEGGVPTERRSRGIKDETEEIFSRTISKPPVEEVGLSRTAQAQRFAVPYADALLKRQHELDRYANIDTMDHEKKLEALKDMNLNPFMLSHPYDGLTNSIQRWQYLTKSPKFAGLTPEQKTAMASNYYDRMLVPFYQKMGAEPISKERWMQQAYGAALKWNIDDAYQSHWKQGIFAGFRDLDNVASTSIAVLGGVLKDGINVAESMGMYNFGKKYMPEEDALVQIGRDVKWKGGGVGGYYKHLVGNIEDVPVLGSTYKGIVRTSSEDGFWHDINPAEKWYQGVGAWVEEQAMMMPLYSAVGKYTPAGIQMLSETGITSKLLAHPAGKVVAHLLVNGAEGTGWGLVMRDEGDKHNAWQDGLGQAILGTIFHGIGGAIGKSKTTLAKKAAERLALGAKGLKEGTTETLEEAMVDSASHTMAAGGRPLQNSVIKDAMDRVREFSKANASPEDIKKAHAQDISTPEGKLRHTRTWEHISYIQKFLGEKGKASLEDLSKEEQGELVAKLQKIQDKAAKKAPSVVKPMQETAGKKAVSEAKKTPGGKSTLQKLADQEKKRDLAAGIPEKKPEEYNAIAEQRLAESVAKASKKAAKESSKEVISEAIDVDKKGDEAETKQKAHAPSITHRTTRVEDKYGNVSVSFDVKHSWISYMKNAMKDAKLDWRNPKDLANWLQDLSHEDFVADLHDHFYPTELKNAGLYFEHQNVRNLGKENPNFLAFMYNYTDHMPREFAKELSSRLEDSMKFEETFSARKPTEVQKEYYAKGMWNHVSDFLHSSEFESGERNIYRSTYDKLKEPTVWQIQLHEQVIQNEKTMLKEMYSNNPDAMSAALAAHEALSDKRQAAFLRGRQEPRQKYTMAIDELLSQTGERERMAF